MNSYARGLFVTFASALLAFSTTPCHSQEEGQLLNAGLLGYTGGIPEEAMLIAPAASGQVFGGPARGVSLATNQPSSSFNLRLGSFRHNDSGLDSGFGNVPFFGIGATRGLSEIFSFRFSVDFGSGEGWDGQDLLLMPMKASFLLNPVNSIAGGDSGYFRPYLGLGFELDYIYQTSWDSETFSEWGYGVHFLAGAEFVINNFSLGLELDWSSVEVANTYQTGGGLSLLLNLGFHF